MNDRGVPRPLTAGDRPEWLRMRTALWPDDHGEEADRFLDGGYPDMAVLVVDRLEGGLCAFAELGLRPFAEGCASSPIGYLEGIWVDEDSRRKGHATRLVAAGREWCRNRGCSEMASDCAIDNEESRLFHLSQGFEEAERIICFRTALEPVSDVDGGDG